MYCYFNLCRSIAYGVLKVIFFHGLCLYGVLLLLLKEIYGAL